MPVRQKKCEDRKHVLQVLFGRGSRSQATTGHNIPSENTSAGWPTLAVLGTAIAGTNVEFGPPNGGSMRTPDGRVLILRSRSPGYSLIVIDPANADGIKTISLPWIAFAVAGSTSPKRPARQGVDEVFFWPTREHPLTVSVGPHLPTFRVWFFSVRIRNLILPRAHWTAMNPGNAVPVCQTLRPGAFGDARR